MAGKKNNDVSFDDLGFDSKSNDGKELTYDEMMANKKPATESKPRTIHNSLRIVTAGNDGEGRVNIYWNATAQTEKDLLVKANKVLTANGFDWTVCQGRLKKDGKNMADYVTVARDGVASAAILLCLVVKTLKDGSIAFR